MNEDDSHDPARRKLAQEAAFILRRLDENPNDEQALADKREFLSKGEQAQRVFDVMQKGFSAAPKTLKDRDRRYSFAILGAILASMLALLSHDKVRLALIADHWTGRSTAIVQLDSGDVTTLDAASAIQDNTSEDVRTVNLLQGSGYFDVDSDGRRFVVNAGEVTAEALGTEFEVMRLDDDVVVTVAEGLVEVKGAGQIVRLTEGQQLRVSPLETSSRTLEPDAIATWRRDQLAIDGMTFGEVVSVIARRMPGTVVVLNRRLAEDRVAGVLDLTEPLDALRVLAETSGAGVRQATQLLTVIYIR